jgi:hypothetical protein
MAVPTGPNNREPPSAAPPRAKLTPGIPRRSILVIIVVVAVILAGIAGGTLLLERTPSNQSSNGAPIAPWGLVVGNPVLTRCPQGNDPSVVDCHVGDYVYTLTIESSEQQLDDYAFVILTSAGTNFSATGGVPGFAVLSSNGSVAAYWTASSGVLSMTSADWTYAPGVAPSTPLTNLYSIAADVGTASPQGKGYFFVADGVGQYSGDTSRLSLP